MASMTPGTHSEQSLQQFINQSPWDYRPIRERLLNRLVRAVKPAAWVIGEVAFPKHGRYSAAVHRQYVRSQQKVSNCQLAAVAILASPEYSIPVNWRLVLPEPWGADNERRARARLPDDVQLDVDGDPLALAHDDQVDVLDGQANRVPLHVLRQGELAFTVEFDGQQRVGVLERQHRGVARQRNVHRVRAVTVENGRHQVVAAQSTRSALAELVARLGAELHLGHTDLLIIMVGAKIALKKHVGTGATQVQGRHHSGTTHKA
jgi:hypothetical protein